MSAGDDNRGRGPNQLSDELAQRIRQEVLGVGYRRPPKHAQFQKGQSGKPGAVQLPQSECSGRSSPKPEA